MRSLLFSRKDGYSIPLQRNTSDRGVSGGSLEFVIEYMEGYTPMAVRPEGVVTYPAYTPLYLGVYEKINV